MKGVKSLALCVMVTLPCLLKTSNALPYPIALIARLDESDMVVIGEIVKEEPLRREDGATNYLLTVGTIDVEKTFKGQPIHRVLLVYPAGGDEAISELVQFQLGLKGIWCLRKNDDKHEWFSATFPGDFIDPTTRTRKQVEEKLTRLKYRKFGDPEAGLSLFAIPAKDFFAEGDLVFAVGFKNIGDSEIMLKHANEQLSMTLTLPDGKSSEIEILRSQPAAEPAKDQSRTTKLKPG